MMPRKFTLSATAALSLALLAGCSDVTLYEPGVYKGSGDETASEEAAERRSGALRDRAQSAHSDR
ncbi:hypothetical protein [Aquisalimonas asiatica]|uniref:Uncharacterized protein n=1 Tax=Aquisalimonas asiatica TaxID=406100 RepID=A0A1H8RJZ8_9GAMM|nr:hypothetical protein [Aquisalimonas asiatica]SEO66869.1 hypothetical protein SAMN04488052_10285 [Aquisalimonas asiatica]